MTFSPVVALRPWDRRIRSSIIVALLLGGLVPQVAGLNLVIDAPGNRRTSRRHRCG